MKTIFLRILAIALIPALGLAASVPAVSAVSARAPHAAGGNLVYLPLVQRPYVLKWNTFLGSPLNDGAYSIAVDGNENVYVAGTSKAAWGNPVRPYAGQWDAFVAKLNSSGVLVWNTFLGSSGEDWADGIAVDGSGNVYVAGTSDANWGNPVHPYAGGTDDVFTAKLNSSGVLVWNTFLGSPGDDESYGIAFDGNGNIYVAGYSTATWGSPVNPFTLGVDAFAAKLNGSGTLVWNTFLGPSKSNSQGGISVDGSGNVYVAGTSTASWGNPVRPYAGGNDDAFAAKLNGSGALAWNTFLGSPGDDESYGIAFDGNGNVFVGGESNATWGSPVNPFTLGWDAFAAKLNGSGTLVWNTFLGSSTKDYDLGITVDGSGNVYAAGTSSASWGNPVNPYAGGQDAFAAKLNGSGALIWNTFLGTSMYDYAESIAVDGSGNDYVAGDSAATWGNPVNPYAGGQDVFVAKDQP